MKDKETDYLDRLFASSSDLSDEAEVEPPLVPVSESLSDKLYAISESSPMLASSNYELGTKRKFFQSWPKMTSVAASLLVAIVGFQFYQQQQTLNRLEQAQADLATALHYLGEANRITQTHVRNSLNDNINKAGVAPAVELELDAPHDFKQRETKTKPLNRTL